MARSVPTVAYGRAVPLSTELYTDWHSLLLTDSGVSIVTNREAERRYTDPDLHRRIDLEAQGEPGVKYKLVVYDAEGNPYPQVSQLAVWDYMHSTRTIETFIHDEDSETCEIP